MTQIAGRVRINRLAAVEKNLYSRPQQLQLNQALGSRAHPAERETGIVSDPKPDLDHANVGRDVYDKAAIQAAFLCSVIQRRTRVDLVIGSVCRAKNVHTAACRGHHFTSPADRSESGSGDVYLCMRMFITNGLQKKSNAVQKGVKNENSINNRRK